MEGDMPTGVAVGPGGYFIGRPANYQDRVEEDDDLPSGVAIGPGDYFMGRPANYQDGDDDLPSGVAIGPGGYFIGRPQEIYVRRPTAFDNLLLNARHALAALYRQAAGATMPSELTREATIPSGSRREATVPPDLESQLIKEMNSVMTGSLKHVDRGLLETACRDITDMADELQANKEASRSISGTSNNHGPGVPKIDVAEKMKILKDMLQKIDWQLYKTLPSGYYQGPGQSASSNKSGVAGHEPELPHWILKRTGRIFVDLNKLVDLLTSISSENSSEPVILPIVGLGGIGKTTLAKLLYSHTKFKDYSKAWVKNPNDGLFREQLPLGDNKILVVLDDLQDKAGRRILDMKRNLIRDVGKNAIVIVTTCSEGAAKKIHTVQPYKLQADMWFAKIEPTDELPAPGDTDSTLCEVLGYLKQSYNLMPPDLILCFQYCGIFPEGHSIVKEDIIHQWLALDLINQYNSFESILQLGEEYIKTLLDISFLQPPPKLPSTIGMEGGTSFTMHDVVHVLARSEADDVTVLDGRNGKPSEKKDCKYALVTNFDVTPMRLSNILAENVMALHLLDCSKVELVESSFSFAKGLSVLNIREPSMKKLPGSICQLTQLTYLNLSGCSGLTKLPESFGNLTSMLYINLSGCSGIKSLPKSFGNLTTAVHVNLSGCHGLDDLPQSFCKLRNLEYLDLSFCPCLRELTTALSGLTNLRHLNLSNPCYYSVEHKDHLEQLQDVWIKLTKLQYLNLSMFMNPISCYLPEGESVNCIQSINGLSSLEHLDLSHNIFIVDLPECLGDLSKLHTLHLSGCIRLKRIDKKITEMKCLKNIVLRKCPSLESYTFVVHSDDDGAYDSNIVHLKDVSCRELEISCLEKVTSIKEAKSIRLDQKRKLEKLTLGWTWGFHESFVDDEALLAELVPPQNLLGFELKSYRGTYLPAWLTSISCHLPNLVWVSMEDIPNCSALPPLFLLPNLQQVALRKIARITKVDAGELSGGNSVVLHRYLRFILDDLENLQEFNTIYPSGSEEFMLPIIHELEIQNCPKVKIGTFLSAAQRLQISACDRVMYSLPIRAEQGGQPTAVEASSSTSTNSARVTQLVVKDCKVPLGDWSLLHHLPGLRRLEIWNCSDLSGSLENFQVTSSLQALHFYQCNDVTTLPECLGDFTSLRQLAFNGCENIKSLPQSINKLSNLMNLRIWECPELKDWCESEENRRKLANIQPIYEKF